MSLQIKTLSNGIDEFTQKNTFPKKYLDTVQLIVNRLIEDPSNYENGEQYLDFLKERNPDFYELGVDNINIGKRSLDPKGYNYFRIPQLESNIDIKEGYTLEEYIDFIESYKEYSLLLDDLESNKVITEQDRVLNPEKILKKYEDSIYNNNFDIQSKGYMNFSIGDLEEVGNHLKEIMKILSDLDSGFDLEDNDLEPLKRLFTENPKIIKLFSLVKSDGKQMNLYLKSNELIKNKEDINKLISLVDTILDKDLDRNLTISQYIDSLKVDKNIVSIIEKHESKSKKIKSLNKVDTENRGFLDLKNYINDFLSERNDIESEKKHNLIKSEIKRIINVSFSRRIGEGLKKSSELASGTKLKSKIYSRLYRDYNSGEDSKIQKIEKTLIYIAFGRKIDLLGLEKLRESSIEEPENNRYLGVDVEKIREIGFDLELYNGEITSGVISSGGPKSLGESNNNNDIEFDKILPLLSYIKSSIGFNIVDDLVLYSMDLSYCFFKVKFGKKIKTIFVSDFFGKATYIFDGNLNIPESGDIKLSKIGEPVNKDDDKIFFDRVFHLGDNDDNWLGRINSYLIKDIEISNMVKGLFEIGFFREIDMSSRDSMLERVKDFNTLLEEDSIETLDDTEDIGISINKETLFFIRQGAKKIPLRRFMTCLGLNQYLNLYTCSDNEAGDRYSFEEHIKIFFEENQEMLDFYEETIKSLYKNKPHYEENQEILSDIDLLDRIIKYSEDFCDSGNIKKVAVRDIFCPDVELDENFDIPKGSDCKVPIGIQCDKTLIIALGGDPSEGIDHTFLTKAAELRKEEIFKNATNKVVKDTLFDANKIVDLNTIVDKEEIEEIILIWKKFIEEIKTKKREKIKDEINDCIAFIEAYDENQVRYIKECFGYTTDIDNKDFAEKIFMLEKNSSLDEKKEIKKTILNSDLNDIEDFKKLFSLGEKNTPERVSNKIIKLSDNKVRKKIYEHVFKTLNKELHYLINYINDNKNGYEINRMVHKLRNDINEGNKIDKNILLGVLKMYKKILK